MAIASTTSAQMNSLTVRNNASPGDLVAVNTAGSFSPMPGGPRLTSDTSVSSLGWSADMKLVSSTRAVVYHTFNVSGGQNNYAECWYFMRGIQYSGANNMFLMFPKESNGNQKPMNLFILPNGNFGYNRSGQWSDQDTGVAAPLMKWYKTRLVWSQVSGSNYNIKWAYRYAGSSTWNTITELSNVACANNNPTTTVQMGCPNQTGAAPVFQGRYGFPDTGTIGTYSADKDSEVSGRTDPPTSPITWYFDPTNGSDSNDGITSGTPLATAAKITDMSNYGGFFDHPSPSGFIYTADSSNVSTAVKEDLAALYWKLGYAMPGGDKVLIKYAGGVLHRLTSQLIIRGQGVWQDTDCDISAALRTRITYFSPITQAQWSKTAGRTNVYQCTANRENACRPFQNGRLLTQKTSVAAVDAEAGSYYDDNTTLYIYALDGVIPTSAPDGTFERTRPFGAAHATQVTGRGSVARGLYISGTMSGVKDDPTNASGSYCLELGSGISIADSIWVDYWDKHGIGCVNGGVSGRRTIRLNCWYTRGHPTADQWADVDFVDSGFIGSPTTGVGVTAPSTFTYAAGVPSAYAVGLTCFSSGFTNAANNGTFTITAIGTNSITVSATTLVTESAVVGKTLTVNGNDNGVYYERCEVRGGNAIMDKSSTPIPHPGNPNTWGCHGTGAPINISRATFIDCDFASGGPLSIQTANCITHVRNGMFALGFGQIGFTASGATFSRSFIPNGTYNYCYIRCTDRSLNSGNANAQVSSSILLNAFMNDSLIELSPQAGTAAWNIVSGNHNLTMRRSSIMLRSGKGLIDAGTSTNLKAQGNTGPIFIGCTFYLASTTDPILTNYNDGSTTAHRNFAQLQTLGIIDNTSTLVTIPNIVSAEGLIPPLYNAGDFTGAANIRLGTVNGPYTGTLAVPSAGNVLSGVSVDAGTGTLTLPTAANVRNGISFGVAGNGSTGSLVVPNAFQVLSGVSFDGTSGNVVLPSPGNVRAYTSYGPNGNSLSGTCIMPTTSQVQSGVQFDTTGSLTGTLAVPGVQYVFAGQAVGSSTGTLTLTTAANVRSGITFGVGGNSVTGSCAVPPAGSVALGVPVDNTTGTAAIGGTGISVEMSEITGE